MKTLLALCLLFAVTVCANDGTPPQPTGDKARFTVVSGMVDHGAGPVPIFMRLDTYTGKTWMLQAVPIPGGKGAMVQIWVPSQEMDSTIYNSVLQAMASK